MNSNQPILHVSIYYQGNSKSRAKLNTRLSVYAQRLLSDPWESSADIYLDTYLVQKEKQVQQEAIYGNIITNSLKQILPTHKEIYTVSVLLISLARQRVFENNPNTKADAWLIISIVPSTTDDLANKNYDIQWSLGQLFF